MKKAFIVAGRRSLLLWTGIYVVLLVVLALEVLRPVKLDLPQPTAADPQDVAAYDWPAAFVLGPMASEFGETRNRPLFSPSRRLVPVTPVAAMQRGQFQLLGALITPEKRIAMLREIRVNRVFRLEQGGQVNGMVLSDVQPEKVVFTYQGETEEVVLKVQTKAADAQAPQPVKK